jgi:hypothetical protein
MPSFFPSSVVECGCGVRVVLERLDQVTIGSRVWLVDVAVMKLAGKVE